MKTKVALEICARRLCDCDEYVERALDEKTVKDYEWEIIATDELTEQTLALKKHDAWLQKIDKKYNQNQIVLKKKRKAKKSKKAKKLESINKVTGDEEEIGFFNHLFL